MTSSAQLTIDGKTIELPIRSGSIGPRVLEVGKLTNEGVFTIDQGYVSTASCDSRITYIDGDRGVLQYRGYPIEQLAESSNHLETCYLLLEGELPTRRQYDDFVASINANMAVDPSIAALVRSFPRGTHPMAILIAALAGLAGLYHQEMNILDPAWRKLTAHRLIAKIPTLAAMTYKHYKGEEFIAPDPKLSYAENFLHMTFGKAGSPPAVSKTISQAMDRIFLLHADHEQNASTSTVRMCGSTEANPYACIAAGTAALWGPSHGGANEAVVRMLEEIGSVDRIPEYVRRAQDKDDSFKIMGFGHRVYKNFDPRAKVIQSTCHAVLKELGLKDPLLDVAQELERIALHEHYFIERRLYPNVDFYSGITLKAVGIPTEMFTVIFALGRTPGWITQWDEMLSAPFKINRPRQLYLGATNRTYTPIASR